MNILLRKVMIAVSALAFVAATPAHAVSCWQPDDANAARVRQFEVLLMIVSLRCKTSGSDIISNYERFRTAQRPAIALSERKIRARYGVERSRAGKLEYEAYMTKLGNHYGRGNSDTSNCRMFGAVMDELGRSTPNDDALATFAMEMVRDPIIEGERCAAPSAPAAKP